jgi:hypothetical protein
MNGTLNGRWQSAEPQAEQSADDPDVRWLSYAQIAALRSISRASAERMVRKHRWRRIVNNHGITGRPFRSTMRNRTGRPP